MSHIIHCQQTVNFVFELIEYLFLDIVSTALTNTISQESVAGWNFGGEFIVMILEIK